MNTNKPILLDEEAYRDLAENYGGFCVACRAEAYGVEPDARHYRCETCGANAVFGVEELLIRGVICFSEDESRN